MQVNRTLTSIDLSDNELGPKGAAMISGALKVHFGGSLITGMQANCTLASINLGLNGLGAEGGAVLGEALQVERPAALVCQSLTCRRTAR